MEQLILSFFIKTSTAITLWSYFIPLIITSFILAWTYLKITLNKKERNLIDKNIELDSILYLRESKNILTKNKKNQTLISKIKSSKKTTEQTKVKLIKVESFYKKQNKTRKTIKPNISNKIKNKIFKLLNKFANKKQSPKKSNASIPNVITQVNNESKKTIKNLRMKYFDGHDITYDKNFGIIYNSKPQPCDDLSLLLNIDKKTHNKLNQLGIYTYRQIAYLTEDNYNKISKKIDLDKKSNWKLWTWKATIKIKTQDHEQATETIHKTNTHSENSYKSDKLYAIKK